MSINHRYFEIVRKFDDTNTEKYLAVHVRDLFRVLNIIYFFPPDDIEEGDVYELAIEIGNFENIEFIRNINVQIEDGIPFFNPEIKALIDWLNSKYGIFWNLSDKIHIEH